MRDNFKVIDADRHVLEPSDLFEKYLPAKFRGRVKIRRAEPVAPRHRRRTDLRMPTGMRPTVKQEDYGFTFGASKRWRRPSPKRWRRNSTPLRTLRDMDREGGRRERFVSDSWPLHHVA